MAIVKRVLVLHDYGDGSLQWFKDSLEVQGKVSVTTLSGDELFASSELSHSITNHGAEFSVIINKHKLITKNCFDLVINRLTNIGTIFRFTTHADDILYCFYELQALYLGLLHSFSCPVLNRPSSGTLAVTWHTPADWQYLALKSGLQLVNGIRFNEADNVEFYTPYEIKYIIFCCGQLCGVDRPYHLDAAIRQFARGADCDILCLTFVIGSDLLWRFHSATTIPNLQNGGEELITAILSKLESNLI